MQKIAIIDSFSLLHRAWHAIPPTLTTKDGRMVNAVYGFTAILLRLMQELKPDYLVAAFDLPQETFRHKEYKEYKATREAPEKDFIDQITLVEDVLHALEIPILALPGYEADDVVGSLAHHFNEQHPDMDVIIVSGDLDTLQLVNTHTKVYTMRKGIADTLLYDEAAVKERYGLKPKQLIDMKALCGDASDNIPGVKGIGQKGAETLVKEFGSLEGIYQHLESDKIKPRIRELLRDQQSQAEQSKMLATIIVDLPIKLDMHKARVDHYDLNKVTTLFQELEFRSLLNKLPKNNGATITQAPAVTQEKVNYRSIDSERDMRALVDTLTGKKIIAFDTETTGLDYLHDDILGASFAWANGQAAYIHLRDAASRKQFVKLFKPMFENPAIKKVGHNIKFDIEVLRSLGIKVDNIFFDTMIAAYLVHPDRSLKLEDLGFAYVGIRKPDLGELAEQHLGTKSKDIDVAAIPPDALAYYGAGDADMTWRLYQTLSDELTKERLEELFTKIEMPLIPILAKMELQGILIDQPYLKEMEQRLKKDIASVEKKIYKLAGHEFNIGSPLQLKEVLFEKLQIASKGIKRKKTGLSTAAAELDKLKDAHPIIPLISDYRELTKLLSTYVKTLPKMADHETGRVHTSFNQAVTSTGRLSSTDPNLQNIPIRSELGRAIRQAFIAPKGCKLISADYSQIELRLAAIVSKDQKMLASFKAGEDIHRRTAAEIYGIKLEEVTPDQRRHAKEVNFGVIYGLGATGLAQRTGMSRQEAKEFIDRYFELYQGVKEYIDSTKSLAHAQGYVETMFGRKRRLPEIYSSQPMLIAAAERMAVNMPLQGTAADLMKLAMAETARELPTVCPEAHILLQVHDELVFEVPSHEVTKAARCIKSAMESVGTFEIPLITDVKTGDNWAEMEPVPL